MARAVRRSDPKTPAKRRTLLTLDQFQALWDELSAASHEHFALDLRKTANLIGFVLFPVGWLWVEYPRARGEALTDVERKAQELGLLGIPDGPDDRDNM